MNFMINVSHMAINFKHLVVNVSKCFLITCIHCCTFLSDRKFDDYCEFSGECK